MVVDSFANQQCIFLESINNQVSLINQNLIPIPFKKSTVSIEISVCNNGYISSLYSLNFDSIYVWWLENETAIRHDVTYLKTYFVASLHLLMFLYIGWLVGWLFIKMIIVPHVVQVDSELLIHLRMPLVFWCSIPKVLGLQMYATMPALRLRASFRAPSFR